MALGKKIFGSKAKWMASAVAAAALAACGGGGGSSGTGSSAPTPSSFSVGGSIAGMRASTTLGLTVNGTAVSVPAGASFSGAGSLANGASYTVAIASQPAGRVCSITAGATGTVASANVSNVAIDCQPEKYVYIANGTAGNISQYLVGADGTLSPMASPTVAASNYASSVAVSPNGKYAYATGYLTGGISQYAVGASGALAPMSTPFVSTTGSLFQAVVDPSGANLYASGNDGKVYQFAISSADGSLGAPVAVAVGGPGANLQGIAIEPGGKFVYVVEASNSLVYAMSVGAGGALTPVNANAAMSSMSIYSGGTSPGYVVADASGSNLYVSNTDPASGNVTQFSMDAAGGLTQVASVLSGGRAMRLGLANGYAFVATQAGAVQQLSVSGTGLLSPSTPSFASVAGGSASFGYEPSGGFAYVPGDSIAVVYQFSVDNTGQLVPLATPTAANASGGNGSNSFVAAVNAW